MNHEGCSNSLSEECTAFHRSRDFKSKCLCLETSLSGTSATTVATTRRSRGSPATTHLARATLSPPTSTWTSPMRSTCSCSWCPWPSSSAPASSVSSARGLSSLTSRVRTLQQDVFQFYGRPHASARLLLLLPEASNTTRDLAEGGITNRYLKLKGEV